MEDNSRNLKWLLLNDNSLDRRIMKFCVDHYLNVHCEIFENGKSLLNRLSCASDQNHHIDFITTNIMLPGMDGVDIIKKIRNLSDNILYHNGLRLKYIPIVVMSANPNRQYPDAIRKIDKNIIFLKAGAESHLFVTSIIKSIAKYRNEIIKEFTNERFSIQFENGEYSVTKSYELPPHIETKYFEGTSSLASKAITRRVLVQNSSSVANVALKIYEELLNQPKTSENELHEFFRLFPEFLLGNDYDVLYSEESFQNSNNRYRMDFVAQPRGLNYRGDLWTIVELKKHTEKILTNKKYHANFSKAVYNGIVQLKNYQKYFNDPRNANEIKKRYNGILPNPKLSLIIGRTPEDKLNLLGQLRNQFPEVSITTYDEVLCFRKIQIQYMKSLGL